MFCVFLLGVQSICKAKGWVSYWYAAAWLPRSLPVQTQLLGCVLPSKGTVFRGCLKSKQGILGILYVIAVSTFDNNYLISREHSLVRFCSLHTGLRTCETCCYALCDTCQTLGSHRRKVPRHLTLPMFHIQGVSPMEEHRRIWMEESMRGQE